MHGGGGEAPYHLAFVLVTHVLREFRGHPSASDERNEADRASTAPDLPTTPFGLRNLSPRTPAGKMSMIWRSSDRSMVSGLSTVTCCHWVLRDEIADEDDLFPRPIRGPPRAVRHEANGNQLRIAKLPNAMRGVHRIGPFGPFYLHFYP